MIINIQDDILKLNNLGLLENLLVDKTTKGNIMWATDAYDYVGQEHEKNKAITVWAITGNNSDVIKTRARKEMEHRQNRTRVHAEVFTPLWICKKINDHIEQFNMEATPETWKKYVDLKCLEITCGEAPFLVSRYDAETGEMIKPDRRIGVLDRKLKSVNQYAADKEEWMKWVVRAFQSTYGYEFQGDNLLIARVNLLMTFEEYYEEKWADKPAIDEYEKIANIISWNLWQMDGLTGTIPHYEAEEEFQQISIADILDETVDKEKYQKDKIKPLCKIYNWRRDNSIVFKRLREEERKMKFDFIIGNPPYQEETEGTSDKPVYDSFMDSVYNISDKVELITPARFLFNAGKTPKAWNKKMLEDEHLTVLYYEQDSSKVFSNTDIKGGVAITYRDRNRNYGAIGTFTVFEELNSVLKKVKEHMVDGSLDDIIIQQNRWDLEVLYQDYPEYKEIIGSNGTEKRLTTPIFTAADVFRNNQKENDLKILGLIKNKRYYKYIDQKYIDSNHGNLFKHKVIVPASNGSGKIGEVLSTPLIGLPLIGYTQSFIGFGAFETMREAEAACKYIKTKFARAMLGTLKITQHNHKGTWVNVPLQNFTSFSDIDWSKSIADIDKQLYDKYGLDEYEKEFIETHVKEME